MAGPEVKVKPPVEPVCVRLKLTRVCALSFAGPTLRAVAKLGTDCAPASSLLLVEVDGRVKLGASLIALMVMVKLWAALVLLVGGGVPGPVSTSVTLNVAVPFESGAER